jgi:hypothetical protein
VEHRILGLETERLVEVLKGFVVLTLIAIGEATLVVGIRTLLVWFARAPVQDRGAGRDSGIIVRVNAALPFAVGRVAPTLIIEASGAMSTIARPLSSAPSECR